MEPNRIRDLMIAYSLVPFLTPNRTRLLLESFDPLTNVSHVPTTTLTTLLNIEPRDAELVKNPLRNEMIDRVSSLRDEAITLIDPAYPPLLKAIIDPPLALYVRGERALLQAECSVAVVGSRRASTYGLGGARAIASQLVPAGIVVVSGLARGIDAAAHEAALDAGGKTIAVLGTGIDVVYPRSNGRLFRRIAEEGLIITEFAPGTPPLPLHFPIRNRVISGLCAGTVIIEATNRSGSLITARMAAEQGREVFALPGSIFSAGSEGTHRLIQYGAKLVHDVNDILDELPGRQRLAAANQEPPPVELREVLETLSREEGTHVDRAAASLQRSADSLAEPLLRLELEGWIRALPGARYVRVR